MKKTILTLAAVIGMAGSAFSQLSPSGTAYSLYYQNATGAENCLANSAPNNGGVDDNGGLFADVSATSYSIANGIQLTTLASGGTANPFVMFDLPLTTGTCSSYRADASTGIDFSTQSNAKVRLYITASADNTPLQFWLGHSGGAYYPTNSTYNIGDGSGASFIHNITVGTTTTYVDVDFTGDANWANWSGRNDIDMWGLTYTGTTANITVSVQKILFGSSLLTATTSATVVNDQVNLFPNPARTVVNVDMSAMSNTDAALIKVMNSNGAVVKSITSSNSTEQISTDGLTKGIYIVQITSGNKIATKKLSVE